MRAGDDERPEGPSHIGSRLTASAIVLRWGGALKPCAFGAPSGLRGLTAPPQRKVGYDAENGSPCLSLTRCCAAATDALGKKMSARNFLLDISNPIQGGADLGARAAKRVKRVWMSAPPGPILTVDTGRPIVAWDRLWTLQCPEYARVRISGPWEATSMCSYCTVR